MAVPPLPTALNTNDVINNAWVDAVYDLLEWFRDDRPVFRGRAWSDGAASDYSVLNNTNTTFGFGTAGAFKVTPSINVGGWTVQGSDADPESLVVPEAGIYLVTTWSEWEANSSGRRVHAVLQNGSSVSTSRVVVAASPTEVTGVSSSVLVDCAASDELDVTAIQTSGSTLDLETHLTAIWVQST